VTTGEITIDVPDGRVIHVYDTGTESDSRHPVFWFHGTPNIGEPPEPLFDSSDRLGLRWISYDRPGYGGSSPQPGRIVASAAADVAVVADALGIVDFSVMGHSGGSPHALACGALLADRVVSVVAGSGLAPFDAPDLDWFAGMAPSAVAENEAALAGRQALERHLAEAEFDLGVFTAGDLDALQGDWAWLGQVAQRGTESGPNGIIDDDLAFVTGWGFDATDINTPTVIIHGIQDRFVPSAHGQWLAKQIPTADLWLATGAGHITALDRAGDALEWITTIAGN
jgi:pimeloyl-ACP methyl ester carboxylesterase